MRSSEHHMKLNEMGEGKCSVPMWQYGAQCFCDKPAYGERPPGKQWRDAYTGQLHRFDGRYNGYVPGLACVAHGGPASRAFMDGDKWCAVWPDFQNLQESESGWGDTPDEARKNLKPERAKGGANG